MTAMQAQAQRQAIEALVGQAQDHLNELENLLNLAATKAHASGKLYRQGLISAEAYDTLYDEWLDIEAEQDAAIREIRRLIA